MRALASLLILGTLTGCNGCPWPFNPSVNKFCNGPCPSLSARLLELHDQAVEQWKKRGACDSQRVLGCPDGTTLIEADGLCSNDEVFNRSGLMVAGIGGCEESTVVYGRVGECRTRRVIAEPCVKAFSEFEVTGLKLNVWTPVEVVFDGEKLAGGTDRPIALGPHRLVFNGDDITVLLEQGGSPGTVRMTLSKGSAPYEVTFNLAGNDFPDRATFVCPLHSRCSARLGEKSLAQPLTLSLTPEVKWRPPAQTR